MHTIPSRKLTNVGVSPTRKKKNKGTHPRHVVVNGTRRKSYENFFLRCEGNAGVAAMARHLAEIFGTEKDR